MSYYRELARDVGAGGAEQNEAFVGGGSQSLPGGRNVVHRPGNSLPVNNEPRIDGYDELFDPPVQSDYECPICMMCLRDPVQTACGHRFCKSCIHRHLRTNGAKCPSDNQPLLPSDVFDDNFAKREINQFTVKCRTVKNGKECPWKGELHKIENHLATCEFLDVICTKGCGQTIERRALDNHVKKECTKRMTTCPHCKTDVQHRNYKDHLERCQKVNVSCPQCSKKMLREKLATHDKECLKAQAQCEFKPYGCKWVGLRSGLSSHLQTDLAPHLSLLLPALSILFPNGREKSKVTAPKSDAIPANLEELSHKAAQNEEKANEIKEKIDQIERKFRQQAAQQQADRDGAAATMKNSVAELEARSCNGVFLWRITGYAEHLENARQGLATAVHSPPFYTAFYGYKLCLRINPNGVDTGYGSHVSLFVHMMQSEWDDILEWPFAGRISLSILDQSDDGEYKRHISETLVTRPNLLAFQRPTTPRNHKGYGYVEFAHLETLQERQYVKNDCLLVRVQVYN